jgi:phage terminase large subunit
MIYEEWDADVHLIPHKDPPKEWRRVWVVDFGYTHPLCFQSWAIDPNGTAYRYFEIYQTHLLVEDLAALITIWRRNNKEPEPEAIVCDWDAEGRATLERHLETNTTPANKNVLEGIEAVKSKLKVREDTGKPAIMLMRDSLYAVDPDLSEAKLPTCTEEEVEGYEWDDVKKKEQPKKIDDHGCDDVRYLAMYETDNTLNWSRGRGR